MKAISLPHAEASLLIQGAVPGVYRHRGVPRHMIGRRVVIHCKRTKTSPGFGLGTVTFGEARPQDDGRLLWPVTSIERWAEAIVAPGGTGFFNWTGSDEVVF